MKISPLTKKDLWYHRVLSDPSTETQALSGVPAETVVHMESVQILHHGPERNYRPYLHLHGQLTEVIPDVELPYGITSLPFKEGSAPTVDAFYEFDNDQLADLVEKDYFSSRFRVPDAMIGIPWDLPGRVDALVVAPAYTDQPPLVFVALRDQNSQELTEANSDYDLSEYFPDYTPGQREREASTEREMRVRSDEIKDIFADVELDEQRGSDAPERMHYQESEATVPKGIFDKLMEEVQSSQQERLVASVTSNEYDPRTAEGLYHGRVAPDFDAALSREVQDQVEAERDADEADYEDALDRAEAEAEKDEGYLDLLEEEEAEAEASDLGVTPVDLGETEKAEAHRRAAERKQRRRHAELANEEFNRDTPEDQSQPGL